MSTRLANAPRAEARLFVGILALVLNAPAGAAEVFSDANALDFWTHPAQPSCDQSDILDLEELPMYSFIDDAYVERGVYISTTVGGAWVDDNVAEAACRGTRCARTPFQSYYGDELPHELYFSFDPPVQAMSMYLIDFGLYSDTEQATVTANFEGEVVEEFGFVPGGNDLDGGVFLGLVFDAPVDEVYISAEVADDGFGFDDLWFPAPECHDVDGDGYSVYDGDCDESDTTVHPGAEELCDGIDNDCDGAISEMEEDNNRDFWMDCEDVDGDGVTFYEGDCDEADPTVHLGAEELCDERDNDCDGVVPERELDLDFDLWPDCVDTDGDGVATADGDCRPSDPLSYPGANEICDGHDNRCVGEVVTSELDLDHDGVLDCVDQDGDGYDAADGDCDDEDATTHPGANEVCDGVDNDCDGVLPRDERDADNDQYMICELDCVDTDPAIRPEQGEPPDGYDWNCDDVTTGGLVSCSAVTSTPLNTRALSMALMALAFAGRRRR